jgi:hypothetical protein
MASLHEHGDDDKPGREYDDELLADISLISARRMLLKMKTRSTEEYEQSRMPNVPSVGGMEKPTQGTRLTAETSTVPSLQQTIAGTTRQSGTSLKQLC